MNHLFRVQRENLYEVDHAQQALPDLQEGEIRLKIDKYALTSNNITYAVSGAALKYWDFFPTDAPYGIIPVWGFAEVVDSKHPEIPVGERCYGYFPMATYCTVQPQKVSSSGFYDGAEHRRDLPSIYNNYSRIATSTPDGSLDDYIPIIRPLFASSFMIAEFLKEDIFKEVKQVVITSASAKTSLGLAFVLKQEQAAHGRKIIGLTSAGNIDFVQSTKYYDQVLAYEDYQAIKLQQTVIADMCGNIKLLENLSTLLGDQLVHIAMVGLTDWKSGGNFAPIPKGELFFAPAYFRKFYRQHGRDANRLLNEALGQFIHASQRMVSLEFIKDKDHLSRVYLDMLNGRVDPGKGYLVQL